MDLKNVLLDVQRLSTYFFKSQGTVKAVSEVSFPIFAGRALGLVGESGCGKSVTALSLMRLIPSPGRVVSGKILLEGQNIMDLSAGEMRRIRGKKMSMIFQEPMVSLNPVYTIGDQIMEAIMLHQNVGKSEALEQAEEMLRRVLIPQPSQKLKEYPHQLSGGMRQRAMIAMALSCRPKLLIADEPTTALDVTIQAQILDLLIDLQRELQLSILIISHDLGVIAELASHVAVMYASRLVEYADIVELYTNPLHPYTQALYATRPSLTLGKKSQLAVIPGIVPNPVHFPSGCKFHPRCQYAQSKCRNEEPILRKISPGHQVSCHYAGEE